MDKEMLVLKVATTNHGNIEISQDEMGEDHGVVVHPDQVPTLIKWLEEAVAELRGETKGQD